MPTNAQIENFKLIAIKAMDMLLNDFPEWKILDAAACLGNLGYETAGMTIMQEIKPVVKGSRGGYGWAQWTGSRRVAFEKYCERNKLDPASFKANYAWLFLELRFAESATIPAVAKASGLPEKTRVFEAMYERAGVKNYDSRIAWAEIARDAYLNAQANGKISDAASQSETGKETAMDYVKNILASKTIWGVLVMLLPTLGSFAGLDIDGDAVNGAHSAIDTIVQGVGALIAIWGRVTAKAKVTILPKK